MGEDKVTQRFYTLLVKGINLMESSLTKYIKIPLRSGVVAHTCNPNAWGALEPRSLRTTWATQQDSLSMKKKKKI